MRCAARCSAAGTFRPARPTPATCASRSSSSSTAPARIEGSPEIISGGGSAGVERAAAEAARRAVSRCAPYNLPADKYEAWADVIVNFDPSEMF